jgi:hypothetical protein
LEKYLLGVKLLVFIDKKETNPRTIDGILGPAKAGLYTREGEAA